MTCPRCTGRMLWDRLERESFCIACGHRPVRVPLEILYSVVEDARQGRQYRRRRVARHRGEQI